MVKQKGPAKLVKSAIRTVALFEVFADVGRPLSLGELSARMEAPKSSCYELLQTLIHLGYIIAIDEGRDYYPSRRLFDTAQQVNRFNPIKEKIENALKQLRNQTGETVIIGRLQGNQVVYTEVFDGSHTIRYTARAGDLQGIHASALGKALLGSLPSEAGDKLMSELILERYNDNTFTERDTLEANLAECREKGVYTSLGEYLPDVIGLAYPLQVRGHQLAIGMVGPSQRMEANFTAYQSALMETIDSLRESA